MTHDVYYSMHFDAYFCTACDVWLEEPCGDMDCDMCPARPLKPTDVEHDPFHASRVIKCPNDSALF